MKEYKGYRYKPAPKGGWILYIPGGGSFLAPPQTEAELKAEIDKYENSEDGA